MSVPGGANAKNAASRVAAIFVGRFILSGLKSSVTNALAREFDTGQRESRGMKQ